MVVALALGSNLATPARADAVLAAAIIALGAVLTEVEVATPVRSRAQAAVPQPDYLNTALIARTTLSPSALLAFAKRLELAAGRRPGPRNAPRPLDIDLLLWGDVTRNDPALTLPHPRLASRRFVLEPLAALAPQLRVPPHGSTVAELLALLPPSSRDAVVPVGWRGGRPVSRAAGSVGDERSR